MKLGVGSYTYTWSIGVPGYPAPRSPMTEEALLQTAVLLKLPLVQICDNMPLHAMNQDGLSNLKRLSQEMGLTIEIGTRGADPDHLLRYLKIGEEMGSPLVRTILTGDFEEAEKSLAEVLPAYEAAGIRLGIENYEQYSCRDLAALIDRLGSSTLGVCLDPVNSFGRLECPDSVVELLAPLTFSFHVKDFSIRRSDHKMGYVLAGTPAGEGSLEIERTIETIQQHRSDISVVLELWTPYLGEVEETTTKEREWADKSIQYLRRIVT